MGNILQQFALDLQQIPVLASIGLSLLGALVALAARAWLSRRQLTVMSAAALLGLVGLVPLTARALGAVPFIFASGTVASADQLNANFEHLRDGVTAVEDEIDDAKTRSRTLIIPAQAFNPQQGTDTAYSLLGTLHRTSGNGTFFAPVYLPEGAVITGMTVYVADTSTASGNNVEVQLLRLGNASFSLGAITGFDALNSDTVDPTPGTMVALTQSATYEMSPLRALVLRVKLNGSIAQFNNAVITYQTTDL